MNSLSVVTNGLLPGTGLTLASTNYSSLGTPLSPVGYGLTPLAPNITPTTVANQTQTAVPAAQLAQLNALVGNNTVPTPLVPVGNGYVGLSTGILQGTTDITKLLANNTLLSSSNAASSQNFTGSDLKLIIGTTQNTNTNSGEMHKVLVECHTMSISSYRVKNPVRSLGYTNPKGFSRALRTIAGTMVLTELSVDVLIDFLHSVQIADKTIDSNITKTDQLPPFNITMVFANETGAAASRTLVGVEFLNDGTIYSVQDLMVERTISWMAADFTPLLPIDVSKILTNNITNTSSIKVNKTPIDLMNAPNNSDYVPVNQSGVVSA